MKWEKMAIFNASILLGEIGLAPVRQSFLVIVDTGY